MERLWIKAAGEVSRELKLEEPIPKLCVLVTGSPFDAAIHDAYGDLLYPRRKRLHSAEGALMRHGPGRKSPYVAHWH